MTTYRYSYTAPDGSTKTGTTDVRETYSEEGKQHGTLFLPDYGTITTEEAERRGVRLDRV